MGVQLHTDSITESSKDNYLNLKTIVEQLENNQLIIEMKAYDAINSSDMLLNFVKEGFHFLSSLQYDEITGIIRTKEESELKSNSMEELGNSIYSFKEIMKSILEAANISNQVSRDIEHEIANQRDIIDVIKCKLKHSIVSNT